MQSLYPSTPEPREIGSIAELPIRAEGEPGSPEHDLSVRVTFPATSRDEDERAPVILFSHGATGSKEGYRPLIEHWAAHGYICVQPTHGDSLVRMSRDEKRKFKNLEQKVKHLSTTRHWRTRPIDIRDTIDALAQVAAALPRAVPRLDAARIGVGGHSFGAHTAQMVAGLTHIDRHSGTRMGFRNPRPSAFLWISPQGNDSATDADSWHECTRPTMVVTGSEDASPRDGHPYTWRIEAYEQLPPGDKYLLFIEGAHHGFGGIAGRLRYPGVGPMIAEHVTYVQAASLAFWDAYLKNNNAARQWLADDQINRRSNGHARVESR